MDDFKYLGSWINSTERDIKIRKAIAWRTLTSFAKAWKSPLNRMHKVRVFRSTVESVLLYGCEAWTLTSQNIKRLDGCYTRMLRAALNVHWSQRITNKDLYLELPKISQSIRERSLRFAGHCHRRKEEEVIGSLVLWKPTHGKAKRGRPKQTYVDRLLNETGLHSREELNTVMNDRVTWRSFVNIIGT